MTEFIELIRLHQILLICTIIASFKKAVFINTQAAGKEFKAATVEDKVSFFFNYFLILFYYFYQELQHQIMQQLEVHIYSSYQMQLMIYLQLKLQINQLSKILSELNL